MVYVLFFLLKVNRKEKVYIYLVSSELLPLTCMIIVCGVLPCPPGVLGAFIPAGRQQRHSGLHHSSQRSVRHHRRPGHHHHVCVSRHSQRRERWIFRWPQVRALNLQVQRILTPSLCFSSFITSWQDDVLITEWEGISGPWDYKLPGLKAAGCLVVFTLLLLFPNGFNLGYNLWMK